MHRHFDASNRSPMPDFHTDTQKRQGCKLVKETHQETVCIVPPYPQARQSQCNRQLCCWIDLQGLIIITLSKMEIKWKSLTMLMHVSKVEHGLCIRLRFGMHVSLSSSFIVPLCTLRGKRKQKREPKNQKKWMIQSFKFDNILKQQKVRNQRNVPDHNNMHHQSAKQHVHYPAQKLATKKNVPADAFLHLCKIQTLPCTCCAPQIYQESMQHYSGQSRSPVQPSLNTVAMPCLHHPLGKIPMPIWTRYSMDPVLQPVYIMQQPGMKKRLDVHG